MTEETQYTDEFFINLTMDYDKRDDNIYPLWARWCALSEDRYYIDGKDGHFYTHKRTDREIAIERRRREIIEMVMTQDRPVNEDGQVDESWMEYERYVHEIEMDEEKLMNTTVLSYCNWLKDNEADPEEESDA